MKNFITLILFIFTFSLFAQDMTGAPNEHCETCEVSQNGVAQVIEEISQTDDLINIKLYYSGIKIGSATLKISHIDRKILSATIAGSISASTLNESIFETIPIDRLSQGHGIRYFSNTNESPILEVSPQSVTSAGGYVNLNVKMKDSVVSIPLEITHNGERFTASSHGNEIHSLEITLGLNHFASMRQGDLIGGHVKKYKIN